MPDIQIQQIKIRRLEKALAEATQPLHVAELNSQLVVERAALNEAKAAALPVEPDVKREEDGEILWA